MPSLGPNKAVDTKSADGKNSSLPRNLKIVSEPKTINPHQRSAVLNTLSDAIMHDVDGLLHQFVEYMVGPVIVNSLREIKDERSWNRASR